MLKELRLIWKDLFYFISGEADLSEEFLIEKKFLYPINFSYQLKYRSIYFSPLDDSLIPMRELGGLGRFYLYSRIAAYGLVNYNEFVKSGQEDYYVNFIRTANWVVGHTKDGYYRHSIPLAGMNSGWISCISQGELTSLLSRAFFCTNDEIYYNAARKSIAPFFINIENGGVRSTLPNGGFFFEEYPGTSIKHVLNGCLYAIAGIIDFIEICKDEQFKQQCIDLLHSVCASIDQNIDAWNISGWSTYDYYQKGTAQNYNTVTYHILHISFLKYLLRYSDKYENIRLMLGIWEASLKSPFKRLIALYNKIYYRIKTGYQ